MSCPVGGSEVLCRIASGYTLPSCERRPLQVKGRGSDHQADKGRFIVLRGKGLTVGGDPADGQAWNRGNGKLLNTSEPTKPVALSLPYCATRQQSTPIFMGRIYC